LKREFAITIFDAPQLLKRSMINCIPTEGANAILRAISELFRSVMISPAVRDKIACPENSPIATKTEIGVEASTPFTAIAV